MPSGFVVSITRNGRHRSLHHVGLCWREPGRHYKDFEIWGEVMPPEQSLQSRCKDCFKLEGGKKPQGSEQGGEEDEDGSSSSSSSSSAGGPPAAKKPKRAAERAVVKVED